MTQTLDKGLVRDRFRKRLASYDEHADVQSDLARRLVERLMELKGGRFPHALEIGCGSGTLTRLLVDGPHIDLLYANDMIEECRELVTVLGADPAAIRFLCGDIESEVEIPVGLDLAISNATFQWIRDLAGLIRRLVPAMNAGGTLAFATFGPENLREIRDLTGVGLDYPSAAELEDMLVHDFRILHRTEELTSLYFDTPRDVMRHLHKTGVNALRKESWNRSSLERFTDSYHGRWGAGEKVPLTYHPIIFIAEKKDGSPYPRGDIHQAGRGGLPAYGGSRRAVS